MNHRLALFSVSALLLPLAAQAQVAPAAPVAPAAEATAPLFELRVHLDAASQPEAFQTFRDLLAQRTVEEEVPFTGIDDQVDLVMTGFGLNENGVPNLVAQVSGVQISPDWAQQAAEHGGELTDINGRQAAVFKEDDGEFVVSPGADNSLQFAIGTGLLTQLPQLLGQGGTQIAAEGGVISAFADLAALRASGTPTEQLGFIDRIQLNLSVAEATGAVLVAECAVNDADQAAQAAGSLNNMLYMFRQGAKEDPEAAALLDLIGTLDIQRSADSMTIQVSWTPEQVAKLRAFAEEQAKQKVN